MRINILYLNTFILSILLFIFSLTSYCAIVPVDLRCKYRLDPKGIDNVKPQLRWKLLDAKKTSSQKQTAFQKLVASILKVL